MGIFHGCGACALCVAGDERLCDDLVAIQGVHAWPGRLRRAGWILAADQAVEVPEGLTAFEAATLVNAGATAANAAGVLANGGADLPHTRQRPLRAARRGARGRCRLGGDRRRAVRVRKLADGFPAADTRQSGAVQELQGAFEAVVDCSGAAAAVQPGLALLAPRGLFLVVGYSIVPQLDLAPIARRELRLFGIQ